MKAEPRVQPAFSIAPIALALAMIAAVLVAHRIFSQMPDREARGPAVADMRFEPVALDRAAFAPLRLAGAPARRASGAASLSQDSLLVIERRLGVLGFANALARLDRYPSGYCLAWRKPLPVGRFDNVEAIAAEPLTSGATRLWLMTDDNSSRPLRTLLIAADLPPQP